MTKQGGYLTQPFHNNRPTAGRMLEWDRQFLAPLGPEEHVLIRIPRARRMSDISECRDSFRGYNTLVQKKIGFSGKDNTVNNDHGVFMNVYYKL